DSSATRIPAIFPNQFWVRRPAPMSLAAQSKLGARRALAMESSFWQSGGSHACGRKQARTGSQRGTTGTVPGALPAASTGLDGSGGIAATDDYATGRAGTPLKSGGGAPDFFKSKYPHPSSLMPGSLHEFFAQRVAPSTQRTLSVRSSREPSL